MRKRKGGEEGKEEEKEKEEETEPSTGIAAVFVFLRSCPAVHATGQSMRATLFFFLRAPFGPFPHELLAGGTWVPAVFFSSKLPCGPCDLVSHRE